MVNADQLRQLSLNYLDKATFACRNEVSDALVKAARDHGEFKITINLDKYPLSVVTQIANELVNLSFTVTQDRKVLLVSWWYA